MANIWQSIKNLFDQYVQPYWYWYLIALVLIFLFMITIGLLEKKQNLNSYEQHMKRTHKEFKRKYGHSPNKEPKVKKLPKKQRNSKEIYVIKSHYGNYVVRERNLDADNIIGPLTDHVFKTKKEAVDYRTKQATKLKKQGHSVKDDTIVYY